MIYNKKDILKNRPIQIASVKNISDYNDDICLDEITQRNYRSLSNLSTRHYIRHMSLDIIDIGDVYCVYDSSHKTTNYLHIKTKGIKSYYGK